jgi:hypothetical protein
VAEILLCKAKPAGNSGSIFKGFNAAELNFCSNPKGDGRFRKITANFFLAIVTLWLAKNFLFFFQILPIAFLMGEPL